MIDIDNLIKNRFKLFVGVRSQKEDEEIYAKVYELCFDEIVQFVEENLKKAELEDLTHKLEELKGSEDDNVNAAGLMVTEALKTVPNHRFKLYHRLEYFVDQLLINTLRNKSKN